MKCICGRTEKKLKKLGIAYLNYGYNIRCFPCFTCSKCHRYGKEVDGEVDILKTLPVLCSNCEKCPCGKNVRLWNYGDWNGRRIYFCSSDCEGFYIMRKCFFLFIFALKEQGLQREFRYLLPKIFHEVKKMPNIRCIDCWQSSYLKSKPKCACCGGIQCFAMRERAKFSHPRLSGWFWFWTEPAVENASRFTISDMPTNGYIYICDTCERRRPVPECSTSITLQNRRCADLALAFYTTNTYFAEVANCRFANQLYLRNYARKKVVAPKQTVLAKHITVKNKHRNPKDMGFVPKKQNRGKMGNFKKKHR